MLRDAQRELPGYRPRNTWFGRYPLSRIDHVFATPDLDVLRVRVLGTELACIASDHRPLVVDLRCSSAALRTAPQGAAARTR